LECGAQATGGNFSKDWKAVPDLTHIGFPIAEAYPDGSIVITKHDKLGGLVSIASVAEQLLYEIGDPRSYITPDGIAHFTTIQLKQVAKNRVEISGVKGRPSTEFYKVSMSYHDGYSRHIQGKNDPPQGRRTSPPERWRTSPPQRRRTSRAN